jgi:hypothetical protein
MIPNASVSEGWRTAVALGVILFLVLGYFAGGQGWNQNSRLALTLALVDHGEVSIDRYHDSVLPTGDKAVHGGRFYSDKAIGVSVLGMAPYAVIKPALDRIHDERRRMNLAMYGVVLAAVALPVAAAAVALFLLALRLRGDARLALFAPIAVVLGTPVWPFSTVLFGHATAAAALLGTFCLLRRIREQKRESLASAAGAGLLGSLAVVTEYTVAPLVVILAGYAVFVLHDAGRLHGRQLLVAAIGVALPLSVLLAYNVVAFGSPWRLGYQALATEEFRKIHSQGLVGIGWPSLEVVWYLTFHPARGLFAHAPVLLLAIPGLWVMVSTRAWRAEGLVIALCFVTLLLINAGFPMWWGGWSASPRHLLPAVLLLGVPLAFVRSPWRPLPSALLALSVLQAFLLASTTPLVPDTRLASFLAARTAEEWLPVWGFSPLYGDAVASIASGKVASNAFMSCLGSGGSLLPLACLIGAGVALLGRSSR